MPKCISSIIDLEILGNCIDFRLNLGLTALKVPKKNASPFINTVDYSINNLITCVLHYAVMGPT